MRRRARHRAHGRKDTPAAKQRGTCEPGQAYLRRAKKYVTLVTGCVARAAARRTHRTPGSAAAVVRASVHPDRASRRPKKSPTRRRIPSAPRLHRLRTVLRIRTRRGRFRRRPTWRPRNRSRRNPESCRHSARSARLPPCIHRRRPRPLRRFRLTLWPPTAPRALRPRGRRRRASTSLRSRCRSWRAGRGRSSSSCW